MAQWEGYGIVTAVAPVAAVVWVQPLALGTSTCCRLSRKKNKNKNKLVSRGRCQSSKSGFSEREESITRSIPILDGIVLSFPYLVLHFDELCVLRGWG